MSAIEESEDDISEIFPESLPATRIFSRSWHFVCKICVKVLDIWIEESEVEEYVPEKDVNVIVSSDVGRLERVEESVEAVDEAALEELDYALKL